MLLKLRNGMIVEHESQWRYKIISGGQGKLSEYKTHIQLIRDGKGGAYGDDFDVIGPATNMVIKENGEMIEEPITV